MTVPVSSKVGYSEEEAIDLLRTISDTCIERRIYNKAFITKSSKFPDVVLAVEEFTERRRVGPVKQSLKRTLRSCPGGKECVVILRLLYDTATEDLLLYVNDKSPLVQTVVQWRFRLGR